MQRIPPVALAGAAALMQAVLARRAQSTRTAKLLAGVIAAGSLGLGGAAVGSFLRHGTSADPMDVAKAEVLVRSGVYRFTRNPMYLSLAGGLLAHAIYRRSFRALVPIGFFVVAINSGQIPAEEQALRDRFGEEFDQFSQQVPRWLGTP